jgi:FAD/FMN-containing dehydrogenase
LRRNFRGDIVFSDDPRYDQARRVWNGMIDKRPAAIAYCTRVDDVVEAIAFARAHDLLVSVRSGGQNIAGLSVNDDGLVIDLSLMKGITVNREGRTVRAEAGLSLGEFDVATQRYGLATTMGVNTDTGIAGLTLGGGFGKLARTFGLTCDNLIGADVLTADGRRLRTSATQNADLFWGIRGGGGNFGIVTAFEYALHPVGPNVSAASFLYDEGCMHEALQMYHEFARNAPDELSADADLQTTPDGKRVFHISVCYLGAADEGERLVKPLRAIKPISGRLASMPYLELQSATDAIFPRGRRYFWKAQFLTDISRAAISDLIENYRSAPSGNALVVFQQVGGAISRVAASGTAYANRDAAYDCFPLSIWDRPADDATNIAWVHRFSAALRPHSTGGVYVNSLGDEGEDRMRAAYGRNYPRLVALKETYDPTNFFRMNPNIQPER